MVLDPLQLKIESQRLTLVPISKKHAEGILKEFTSEITTYMYPKPPENIDDVLDFISHSLETMKSGSNLQLVVTDLKSGVFLGCIGLHHIDRKDPELGIWLKKSAQGKNYGLEAMGALVSWAKENLNFEYLKYPVDKKNTPSRKIPIALGGVLKREFKAINLSGKELDEVEYWIYKNSNNG